TRRADRVGVVARSVRATPALPVLAEPKVEARDQGALQSKERNPRTRPRRPIAGNGSSGTTDDESAPVGGLVREAQLGPEKEPVHGNLTEPLDWLRLLPHETAASSDRLGWVRLQAAHCRAAPAFELNLSALTHHRLFLFSRPPDELDIWYEGVKRH